MDRLRSLLGTGEFPGGLVLCLSICLVGTFTPLKSAVADARVEHGMLEILTQAEQAKRQQLYDEALKHFQHAQRLIHVEDGVLSPEQNPILEQMAIIHLAQGSFANGNRMMEFQHRVVGVSSNYSAEAVAPSWQTLGEWYQKTLQPRKSQHAFEKALEIMDENGLPQGELASIHLGMLKNEYLMVACCDIETALSELEGVSLSAEQWLELGDLAMLAGEHKKAAMFYGKSSATLPATPIGVKRIDHMARVYVEATLERRSRMSIVTSAEMTPTQLVGAPLPFCESRLVDITGDDDYSSYSIDMKFDVTQKGKVRRAKVIESNAPSSVNALLRDQLNAVTYRPALMEGEVQKTKLKITQQFDSSGQGAVKHKSATQLGCVAAARALEQEPIVAGIR